MILDQEMKMCEDGNLRDTNELQKLETNYTLCLSTPQVKTNVPCLPMWVTADTR